MVAAARFVALADCHCIVCGMWMEGSGGVLDCDGLRWVMELVCDCGVGALYTGVSCILPDAGLDALCLQAWDRMARS